MLLSRSLLCLALVFAAGATRAEPDEDTPFGLSDLRIAYENDFTEEPGEEWSDCSIETTPKGARPYLGRFAAETVSLRLTGLPRHKLLVVEFDLYVMNTWDGSNRQWGPDRWELSLAGGPKLIDTTFGNFQFSANGSQAFPDNYPCPPHASLTGAAESKTLGHHYKLYNVDCDSVYRVRAVCPHEETQLVLQCAGRYTDPEHDQWWGLANLKVSVAPRLLQSSDKQLREDLQTLGSDDPIDAVDAMWRLAASGSSVVALLEEELQLKDPEIGFGKTLNFSAESWRIRRARRLLEVLPGPEAERARWLINAPGRYPENPRYVGGQMRP